MREWYKAIFKIENTNTVTTCYKGSSDFLGSIIKQALKLKHNVKIVINTSAGAASHYFSVKAPVDTIDSHLASIRRIYEMMPATELFIDKHEVLCFERPLVEGDNA